MLWIILTISAVVIWAGLNVLDKYLLSRLLKRTAIPVVAQGIIGLIAGLLVIVFHGIQKLSLINSLLSIFSGVTFTVMYLFYFKALQKEETSKVISIFYLSPLFVAILASIFLNEKFTIITYVGISLLIVGGYVISSRGLVKMNRSFWFMLLSAMMMAVTLIFTKYLLNYTDDWSVFAYSRFGSMIATIPIIIINFSSLKHMLKEHQRKVVGLVTLDETLSLVGFFLIITAASTGYVTLINALTSLQPFFVFLIVLFFSTFYPYVIKEEHSKTILLRKSFAMSLIFTGAVLISGIKL